MYGVCVWAVISKDSGACSSSPSVMDHHTPLHKHTHIHTQIPIPNHKPADLSQLREPVAPLPPAEHAALVLRAHRERGADGELCLYILQWVVEKCVDMPPQHDRRHNRRRERTMSSTTRRRSSASATAAGVGGRVTAASKKR